MEKVLSTQGRYDINQCRILTFAFSFVEKAGFQHHLQQAFTTFLQLSLIATSYITQGAIQIQRLAEMLHTSAFLLYMVC